MLGQRLAFDGKDRRAAQRDRGGCMVLGGKDVARRPAHIRAQRDQCFDQNCGLYRHMQRSDDPCARQRLAVAIFGSHCHQSRHFGFGNVQFFAAKFGQIDVFYNVIAVHLKSPRGVCAAATTS